MLSLSRLLSVLLPHVPFTKLNIFFTLPHSDAAGKQTGVCGTKPALPMIVP
jgi:hypothetical protein